MSDIKQKPLPKLPSCPFCGGHAELGWDSDGSMFLEIFHDQTCPTEGSLDSTSWCRWYYPEDWDDNIPQMIKDVVSWWSRRTPDTNTSSDKPDTVN